MGCARSGCDYYGMFRGGSSRCTLPPLPTALSPREGDVPIMGWQPREAQGGALPRRAGSRAGGSIMGCFLAGVSIMGCRSEGVREWGSIMGCFSG